MENPAGEMLIKSSFPQKPPAVLQKIAVKNAYALRFSLILALLMQTYRCRGRNVLIFISSLLQHQKRVGSLRRIPSASLFPAHGQVEGQRSLVGEQAL